MSEDSKSIVKPTILRTTRTISATTNGKSSDATTEEILEIRKFETQPALVSFNYPIRKALEYQSVGIDIGVTLPCYAEEVDEAIEKAKAIVVKHVKKSLPDVSAVLNKLVEQHMSAKTAINRGTWSPK